jgi:hypothetical protein
LQILSALSFVIIGDSCNYLGIDSFPCRPCDAHESIRSSKSKKSHAKSPEIWAFQQLEF